MNNRSLTRFVASAKRVKARSDQHFLALVAAGVAFYGFLALVPTTVVAITIYGIFADPAEIERQLSTNAGAVPEEVRTLLLSQIRASAHGGNTGRTAAVVVGLAVALWTASAGMNGLVRGIDIAHGRPPRKFVEQRGLSLALTLGAVVVLVAVALLAIALPPLLGGSHVANGGRWVLEALRWPLLALVMALALSALYRIAGDRRARLHLRPGPAVGAVLWLVGSAGFAFYTANFGKYGRTYGSLAGIAVVLLWLYLGSVAVLLGAEVDADHAERH